jgi:hypothetical protein
VPRVGAATVRERLPLSGVSISRQSLNVVVVNFSEQLSEGEIDCQFFQPNRGAGEKLQIALMK